MPKPTTVTPTTRLGWALEEHRIAMDLSRAQASRNARSSETQWINLITKNRRFSADIVARAAHAVGMSVIWAWGLAGIQVVPDDARVITVSEARELLDMT